MKRLKMSLDVEPANAFEERVRSIRPRGSLVHVPRMNCSILFGMHAARRLPPFLVLVGLAAYSTSAPHDINSQVAFLNHSFAVVDQATADAIEQSDYVRRFGVFNVHTTHANGGESWTGRYLMGRKTYLELFGPKDGGGDVGTTGIGISPDRVGGLAILIERFARNNANQLETDVRTRQYGEEQVPWFNSAHTHEEGDALSVWALEYLPSFMNDPRSEKKPAKGPDDVISRERSLSDDYLRRLMRDISLIEISATMHDIALARPMFSAAGFRVSQERNLLVARDADTTIIVAATSREAAGIRRVEFVLNSPVATHVEHLGRSTLIVGPGTRAVWRFEEREEAGLRSTPRGGSIVCGACKATANDR